MSFGGMSPLMIVNKPVGRGDSDSFFSSRKSSIALARNPNDLSDTKWLSDPLSALVTKRFLNTATKPICMFFQDDRSVLIIYSRLVAGTLFLSTNNIFSLRSVTFFKAPLEIDADHYH